MPTNLSYINARGEEVVLDDTKGSFAREIVGRTGFEMPQIETETVEYGDGTQDIVIAKMKPRTVTCYFWVDLDTKQNFEHQFREVKSKLAQIGNSMGKWGKLKIRRRDGNYVYLNCIYKSGFDGIVRDSNVRLKFSLTFEATDAYFYNLYDTKYVIGPDKNAKYLMMENRKKTGWANDNSTQNPASVYMASNLFMQSADMTTTHNIVLESQRVYPTISITGTGTNFSLYNELTGRKINISSDVVLDGTRSILIQTKPLERKAVLVKGSSQSSIIQYLSSDTTLDWFLDYGKNRIVYTNSDVSANSKCTITYTERWLDAE